jgi:hypothetical protein
VFLITFVCVGQFVSEKYSATVCVTVAVLLSGGRYGSLAGRAERIGAAIFFGDISDKGTECNDNYV